MHYRRLRHVLREALRGLEFMAPGGKIRVDAKNQHTWKRLRIGRVNKQRQLDLVDESKELVAPEPYAAPLHNRRGT